MYYKIKKSVTDANLESIYVTMQGECSAKLRAAKFKISKPTKGGFSALPHVKEYVAAIHQDADVGGVVLSVVVLAAGASCEIQEVQVGEAEGEEMSLTIPAGYHVLRRGTVIKKGDEYITSTRGEWVTTNSAGFKVGGPGSASNPPMQAIYIRVDAKSPKRASKSSKKRGAK